MNNYAYLIKARAKATEAKSLFCWFSSKSDSRADREILNILEDNGIETGRGADHQLPIRTNWHVVDDLPEEGVLDDSWCDRYELDGDSKNWKNIVSAEPPAAPVTTIPPATEQPIPEPFNPDLVIDKGDTDRTEYAVAEMTFSRRLLAQFISVSTAHNIRHAQRVQIIELSLDTDNHYVQNLLLAASNIPELDAISNAALWRYTDAVKTVFDPALRHELSRIIQFSKLWVATEHIDRGILVREWAKGNRITSVQRTDSGVNAGGGNPTDRDNPAYNLRNLTGEAHSIHNLKYEVAIGILARGEGFNIYDAPPATWTEAMNMRTVCQVPEYLAWVEKLSNTPGILDYSYAAIVALIKTAPDGIWENSGEHRGYINKNLTETDHANPDPLIVDIACGRSLMPIAQRADSGMNAGGVVHSDRLTPQTILGLEYEIALGILARSQEFDIYNVPLTVEFLANNMMNKMDNKEFLATRELFVSMPDGLDYSRACNVATVKTTPVDLWQDPVKHREYLNHVMTETDHAHPDKLIVDIACGLSSSPMPMTVKAPESSGKEINEQLAADRGEYVPGISDPNDPKWLHEDLNKNTSNQGKKEEAETTSNVQMEETVSLENKDPAALPEGQTADLSVEGSAAAVEQTTALNTVPGHHNDDGAECQELTHLMVDVESLGKSPDAPVVSIGAVFFNPATGACGPTFYKVISLESAMASGGIPDASTIIWWLKQSSEARAAIVVDDAIPLDDALLQFNEFICENAAGGTGSVQVWGNGATFDNVLMRRSYERTGIACPWKRFNDRDVRTIVELGKAVGINPRYSIPFEGDMHNALADACHQAKYVSAIWQRLTSGNQ